MRQQIMSLLKTIHPSEAIKLIESIGKELRKENSIRIYKGVPIELLEMDRPDLETLKK